ncbi:MAG: hypothetical protein ACXVJD_14135, partial [Mucilaginibacter sp.]
MFLKIFLFEIQNRVRRPAVYLYFFAVFLFTLFAFATGSLPLAEKVHINAPFLIAFWCSAMTMMMMLVTSSLMGAAIYRDIEYQTKDYYLTYPITKPGYFWGRYLGSFVFMIGIAFGILLGIYLGTILGPALHKTDRGQYGPNSLVYYFYPFLTIALPNIFFTSSLFFGLVAITRNVKVIYFGGILLFLFYFIAVFFLDHTSNATVIAISDPFGINGIRFKMNNAGYVEQNTTLINMTGPFAVNRLLWPGLGLAILIFTYVRFDFEKFFSGKRDKAAIDAAGERTNKALKVPAVSFAGKYNRQTLFNLIRIELLNILRDNYFWIIVITGSLFLGFVFWLGNNNYGVPDLPRTVMLLGIFNDVFPFFIFFIIMFYTGETLQRDRLTRYAFINDSLPPPNWVLNGSKLVSLLLIALGLSFIPLVIGIVVQLLHGFYELNIPAYLTYIILILMPKLLEAVVFCYVIQVIVNNKFAAYAISVTIWVGMFFLEITHMFDYHLLLYSYTPNSGISDMDGMGHMVKPISWFDLYWLLNAGLLIIVSALFYYRGANSSLKERLQLVPERFDRKTKLFTGLLIVLFFAVGAYNYYNISYLNKYLTKDENEDRAISYEKALKHFQNLPLPKITAIKMQADLFPDKQEEYVKAFVSIVNKTNRLIDKMLLDGDQLTRYSISINGSPVPFTYPLFYPRGFFSWFGATKDTAAFRLYHFQKPLAPGDSAVLEVNSAIIHKGFANGLYARDILRNGTFFTGGLPGLGYDDDDEISSPYVRKKAGLAPKIEEEVAQNDPNGINNLKAGKAANLLKLDVTVSTAGDQTAVTHGELVKQWKANGRNYFHYVQDRPGMYIPFGIVSARYADTRDSVMLDHRVQIDIFHHPGHNANTGRFIAAYKAGLKYFSSAYGAYPFKNIRLAETSVYGPGDASTTNLDTYAEYNSWNANFTEPNQFDYLYFSTARNLAQQWWRFQVAPNNTVGSLVIPEGSSNYDALVMAEQKYGKANMRNVLLDQLWYYLFIRRRFGGDEHPLVTANQGYEWSGKASVVFYGLRDLVGEAGLNAALREFKNEYAFKNQPPFAGTNDLFRILQKHVPDSLQYYLTDCFQKVTFYDSRVTDVKAVPAGKKDEYRVTLTVNVAKAGIDKKGNDMPDKNMNDYIDLGIFGADNVNREGRSQTNPLYLKRYKLTAGMHTITVTVKSKPKFAGIDPFGKL